jgi:hypothetical protein
MDPDHPEALAAPIGRPPPIPPWGIVAERGGGPTSHVVFAGRIVTGCGLGPRIESALSSRQLTGSSSRTTTWANAWLTTALVTADTTIG